MTKEGVTQQTQERSLVAWNAFRYLAQWVWIDVLPFYLDGDGVFQAERRLSGFDRRGTNTRMFGISR